MDCEAEAGDDLMDGDGGGGHEHDGRLDGEEGGDRMRQPLTRQPMGESDEPRGKLDARVPERRPGRTASQILAGAGMDDVAGPLLGRGPHANDAGELLRSLVATLIACGTPGRRQPPGAPSAAAIRLAALEAHLQSQARAPAEPLFMHEVKALLVAHPPQPLPADLTGPARTRAENANLLRPLEVHNAPRPRAPEQLRHAVDVLRLVAGTGRAR